MTKVIAIPIPLRPGLRYKSIEYHNLRSFRIAAFPRQEVVEDGAAQAQL